MLGAGNALLPYLLRAYFFIGSGSLERGCECGSAEHDDPTYGNNSSPRQYSALDCYVAQDSPPCPTVQRESLSREQVTTATRTGLVPAGSAGLSLPIFRQQPRG